MAKIKFKIITPEKIVFEDNEVDVLVIPTKEGEITVLPNHIPLVSLLSPGELKIKKEKEEIPLAISSGYLEVEKESRVTILVDTAERVEEIIEERAEEAKKRAEALLKEKRIDSKEFARITAKLEKELARLKVVRKYRKTKRIGPEVEKKEFTER